MTYKATHVISTISWEVLLLQDFRLWIVGFNFTPVGAHFSFLVVGVLTKLEGGALHDSGVNATRDSCGDVSRAQCTTAHTHWQSSAHCTPMAIGLFTSLQYKSFTLVMD